MFDYDPVAKKISVNEQMVDEYNMSVIRMNSLLQKLKDKIKMNKEQRKQEALNKIEELKKLVESIDNEGPDIPGWEECDFTGYYTRADGSICNDEEGHISASYDNHATKAQAESALAFAQLTQIHAEIVKRNCPGWKADWSEVNQDKYCVAMNKSDVCVLMTAWATDSTSPLTLPTRELARAFLDKHRDLWETYYAGL